MTRVVPALIVLAIVALMAATAGHPTAPVPAAAHTETGGTHGQGNLLELRGDGLRLRGVSVRQGIPGLSRVSGSGQSRVETPRQKARRIITATWPSSQVDNAMKVVACESGFNQWALGDNGNSVSWFQIHLPSHPWVSRARARNNPWYASRAALRIWRESGWRAWTCARILGIA